MKYRIVFAVAILCSSIFQAQSSDPLRTKDAALQKKWVDSILKTMTLREKIGQLFMAQAYSNKGKEHEEQIVHLLEKYHVGNLIFMKGTAEKQAVLTNKYQALSKVPMLIGIDAEWGLDMRLKGTFRYPWNMALGAVSDMDLIEDFGKQVGKHCRRLGVHVNFAPVVDINTNPRNPIIGNRSFGANRENVTEKASAFLKGMQGQKVLATAKHFPGHGDTSADSHYTLPRIDFDRQRLDTLELYPYRKLVKEDLTGVMVAHLSVPSLEPDVNLPSSLSKKIVTDLLIEDMGFSGLVITDALNMKGATNYIASVKAIIDVSNTRNIIKNAPLAEINLAAFLAGNDILLIPQNISETMALFEKAIANKTISMARLEHSVRKILKAKYWAGLHRFAPVVLENLHEDLNSTTDLLLHRKLVKESTTLLKNSEAIVPIRDLEKKKIAYVKLGEGDNRSFVRMLKNYTEVEVLPALPLSDLIQKLNPYDLVIIGYHISNAHPWKKFTFKKEELTAIHKIAKAKKVLLDIFASPYSLLDIKNFRNIDGLIVSYQNSEIAQEISAQQIFGALEIKGKLPVTIPPDFKEGTGLLTSSLRRLQYGIPEEVFLSSEKLSEIDSIAHTILREKMAPGFQVLVARYGRVVYQKSFGFHTDAKKQKVVDSDVYDLASLTKILATLPMLIKAETEGKFFLDESLKEMLPEFENTNKDTLTIKEILSHNARLKAWVPFYKTTQDSITGENLPIYYRDEKSKKYGICVAKDLFLRSSYKDSIFKIIREVEQREEIGYKYSDLGYYILRRFLEKEYKKSLDELAETYFYRPLGADRMRYLPLETFPLEEIVPTERDVYYRNQLLQGYPHDMGASMQGGVGGHAGLFANANDVAKMMQMYLQRGFYGGKQYLEPKAIDMFNRRYYEEEGVRRGLGFDKPQLDPEIKATCGCVSDQSFGHSGFTGTYTWADPLSRIVYVFLSNRVHPTMENRGLTEKNIRTRIQQVIQDAILLKTPLPTGLLHEKERPVQE